MPPIPSRHVGLPDEHPLSGILVPSSDDGVDNGHGVWQSELPGGPTMVSGVNEEINSRLDLRTVRNSSSPLGKFLEDGAERAAEDPEGQFFQLERTDE